MINTNNASSAKERCLCERQATADGYTLLYRLFDGTAQEPSGEKATCFHLEIRVLGLPADSRETVGEAIILEDVSRDADQAMALTALLAEECVMPCTALEIMEELFSYGDLSDALSSHSIRSSHSSRQLPV